MSRGKQNCKNGSGIWKVPTVPWMLVGKHLLGFYSSSRALVFKEEILESEADWFLIKKKANST